MISGVCVRRTLDAGDHITDFHINALALFEIADVLEARFNKVIECCDEVLAELGINDPKLELAMRLDEIARNDPYFVERNLYPNVDFYSGIILKAIGIPTSMFTVIFAVSRTVGWISHWKEMLSSPYKIGRPRQLYTGYGKRDYAPLQDRK